MTVAPARLAGWLTGFGERHGACEVAYGETSVVLSAADGSTATVEVPFPPLPLPTCQNADEPEVAEILTAVVEHVLRERTIGVLLARRGGHAAGVFVGDRLVSSKVGGRHVQGRTAAGGWSQQRFARRRSEQAAAAVAAAADEAARILLAQPLDALVLGGDRVTVEAVLADRRFDGVRGLVSGRLLDVPDPRLKVLQEVRFRDVWIRVADAS